MDKFSKKLKIKKLVAKFMNEVDNINKECEEANLYTINLPVSPYRDYYLMRRDADGKYVYEIIDNHYHKDCWFTIDDIMSDEVLKKYLSLAVHFKKGDN